MISFLQYLTEAKQQNQYNKIRDDLRIKLFNILKTNPEFAEIKDKIPKSAYPKDEQNSSNKTNFNSLKPKEVLRAGFGKETDDNKTINDNLKKVLIKLGDEIDMDLFDTNSYVKYNFISGKFKSFIIKKNGYEFYITNNTGTSNIKEKQLIPSNLGLTENSFKTVNKMIDKINSNDLFKNPKTEYIKIIKNVLLEKIKNNNLKITKDGCFKETDVNKVFSYLNKDNSEKEKRGTILINDFLNFDKNLKITSSDINIILKDFGEILGPLIFLKLFNNKIEIKYPKSSNEKLIDYYITTDNSKNIYSISAKANNGAKPSGISIFSENEKLNALLENTEDNDEEFNNLFLKDIDKNDLKIISSTDVKNFVKFLKENYNSSISIAQFQFNLINEYLFKTDSLTNKAVKDIKTDIFNKKISIQTKNEFKKIFLDKIKEFFKSKNFYTSNKTSEQQAKNNIETFFNEYYNALNFKPRNNEESGYPVSRIVKEFDDFPQDTLAGLIIYPLYSQAIQNINDKFCTSKINILSKIINNTIDIKQVYLSAKGKNLLLDMRFSTNSNWKFANNLSIRKMFNQRPAVELIK